MARIVKRCVDISGMELTTIMRHNRVITRRDIINIAEGPTSIYLRQLFVMYHLAPLLAALEIGSPRMYRLPVRLRNSAVFRYKRYRTLLLRSLAHRQD